MKEKIKVIVRIKGGLGNQLFCYAAARRLAIANNAELVIDNKTGFKRDYKYRRKYSLDVFNIPCRKANRNERMEPFERISRGIAKYKSSRKVFTQKEYIQQETPKFDGRLLSLKLSKSIYLDGLWQSEKYFLDTEKEIRNDLLIVTKISRENRILSERMMEEKSVSLHFRWFNSIKDKAMENVPIEYYRRAIELMESLHPGSFYFIFSDMPEKIEEKNIFPDGRFEIVVNNKTEPVWDIWLMSHCSRHIIANSTFSWWGAWLSKRSDKTIICPNSAWTTNEWDFEGLLPESWIKI